MSLRGLLLLLLLATGCGLGDDDSAQAASGRVASGAPRYIVGTLSATAAAATAPAADDYGDDAGRAHGLVLGEMVSGRLEDPTDTDWFSVELRAGVRYAVALHSYGASRVIVIAPDGTELGTGYASEGLEITPTVGGRHFVRVEAQAGRDVFYGLEVAAQP